MRWWNACLCHLPRYWSIQICVDCTVWLFYRIDLWIEAPAIYRVTIVQFWFEHFRFGIWTAYLDISMNIADISTD